MKEVEIMRENENMEEIPEHTTEECLVLRETNEFGVYNVVTPELLEKEIADSHDITKSDFGFEWE